jgi:hypothetical protein
MFRALALDPGKRFQTAGEFQEALLRCAHRHGLMTSAPDLAEQLRTVCGPASSWRDTEEPLGQASFVGAGTEIYEGADEAERPAIEEFELSVVGPMEEILKDGAKRRQRARTSITHLTQLQGIELTSMFNLAPDGTELGAEPLVDLDRLGDDVGDELSLESAPTSLYDDGTDPRRQTTGEPVSIANISDQFPVVGSVIVEDQEPPAPRRRPWVYIGLILLVGLGTAAAIGFTGPSLDSRTAPADGATETDRTAPARE